MCGAHIADFDPHAMLTSPSSCRSPLDGHGSFLMKNTETEI